MTNLEVNKYSSEELLKIDNLAKSFWEIGISETTPKFIILTGSVGSGKTTIRKQQFSKHYVNFDFGDVVTKIRKEFDEDNSRLANFTALASDIILRESIRTKKNLVIEIIDVDDKLVYPVINKMKDIGYDVTIQHISSGPAESYKRHLTAVKENKDYLSAYFTYEATLSFFYNQFKLGELPL